MVLHVGFGLTGFLMLNEKHCLTIDCGYVNKNEPGQYKSLADNPEKQVCCLNKRNDNVFL